MNNKKNEHISFDLKKGIPEVTEEDFHLWTPCTVTHLNLEGFAETKAVNQEDIKSGKFPW